MMALISQLFSEIAKFLHERLVLTNESKDKLQPLFEGIIQKTIYRV